MPQKHSAVWIVAIVLALALGGAAFFLTRGQDPAVGADGSAAAREPGSGAQPDAATAHAKNGAGDPKAGDSKIGDPARASAAASDEAALAELGETVVVKGKLLVLETGEAPKDAIVGLRTGKTELDNAWIIARVGGKPNYDRLQRSGELELKILEAGGPRPITRAQARKDGTFEIRVPKKAVRFSFEVTADMAAYSNPEWFFLSQTTIDKGVTLLLNEAGGLEGKLVDESGQPLVGGRVVADAARQWAPQRPNFQTTQITETDKDGKFSFRGLSPGTVSLTAVADKCGVKADTGTTIEAGKTATTELKLSPEIPLEGLIVDSQGKGVAGATGRLTLDQKYFPNVGFGVARPDSQGRLRWHNLIAGSYRPYAMIEGKRFSEVPETVKLPMPEGAQIPKWVVESGHFVAGKVATADGKPAVGARLRVGPGNADGTNSNDKKRVGTQQGTVDANGTFRVEGVPEGPLNVDVMLENVSSAKKTNIAHDTADLEIELPAMAGIAGTVVDSTSGTPIKAFVVTLVTQREAEQSNNRYWGWNPGQERPQVSETGAFEIGGIAPETYIVRVTADGYTQGETKDVVVKAGEMIRGLTIPLIPGAVISGKVVDALNGQPIPAAEIELVNADEQDNGIRFPGEKVRSDGRFEMRGLKAMRARIVAHHEKFMEAASETVDLHPGERIELPTIALGHGGSVVGIALGRDGAVLPKAQVQAYYSDPRQGNDRPRHAWRNAPAEKDGSFRFEGLKPGQWTVSAMPPVADNNWQQSQNKQLNAKVQIVEGQTANVTFTIPKGGGCKIHGRITRGGKAVTQGNVGLWRQDRGQDPEEDTNNQGFQSQIGANGEYEIEHVSPGKYYFNFNSWSESGSSFGQEIAIPNSPELNYDVALPVGGEVRGRVTRKSDGKALSGMSVSAYSMGPSGPGGGYSQSNATTDSEGKYVLANVSPGQVNVQVEPQRWGPGPSGSDAKIAASHQTATITEGGTTTVDFALDEGATVIVEVVDPDGKPIQGSWVNIIPSAPGGGGSGGYGSTNEKGIAKIQGISPGKVRASVQVEGYPPVTSEEIDAVIGTDARIQVRLARGVNVVIRLHGPDGALLKPEQVNLIRADGTVAGSGYNQSTDAPKDGGLKVATVPGTFKANFWFGADDMIIVDVTIGETAGAVIDLKTDKVPGSKK